jgi:hypothetical protein
LKNHDGLDTCDEIRLLSTGHTKYCSAGTLVMLESTLTLGNKVRRGIASLKEEGVTRAILSPGAGVGGHCLTKDTYHLERGPVRGISS